jgi:hypothetical protein
MSADTALQIAWWSWCALMAFPFVVFLAVIWHLMDGDGSAANMHLAVRWFVFTLIFIAVGVPAAFFWRSRSFRGYWSGQCVAPRDYLRGMMTIWIALELGGLLALVGCLITNSMLPNLLPALLAFMLFIPLWPNGHSMIRPPENERDPGGYSEPR